MLNQGMNQRLIAKALDRHPSVISREIARNCDGRNGRYNADLAQRKCIARHQQKPKHRRLDEQMRSYIIEPQESYCYHKRSKDRHCKNGKSRDQE